MSGQSFQSQAVVRAAIQRYLDRNGVTSLRKIAEYVGNETGISPSASTIARLVREFGYHKKSTPWEKKGK